MIGRLAGQALKIPGSLFSGMSKGEIAGRLAPDALFGIMAGAMTPGDLGDKLIAGGGQAIGGGLGGIGLSKLGNKVGIGGMGSMGLDMAGSFGGDYAGMFAADQIMKAKDKLSGGIGQTPWERMSAEQQQQMRAEMEQQLLWQHGLIPGIRENLMVRV